MNAKSDSKESGWMETSVSCPGLIVIEDFRRMDEVVGGVDFAEV